MSWQVVTRSSLCSGVKECGTNHTQNFLFPTSSFRIRRTAFLGMFKDSAIILDAIRPSFFTKSPTTAMFTSVRVDFGRPPLSSSTSSLSSRNQEYQLKTFDWSRVQFPHVFCTITSVSVADWPTLKQNFMATLCSFRPSITYKENWLYKTSYNSYTVEDKRISACDRLLVDST